MGHPHQLHSNDDSEFLLIGLLLKKGRTYLLLLLYWALSRPVLKYPEFWSVEWMENGIELRAVIWKGLNLLPTLDYVNDAWWNHVIYINGCRSKEPPRPRWGCRCWLRHHTQSKENFFSFQINNEKWHEAEGYLWKRNEPKQNVSSDWQPKPQH